jgi:DNA-binding FadR family transcriptional regulator
VLRRAAADAGLREVYCRGLQVVVDDHRALHEAVTARDTAAASLMHRHLLETARDMTFLLRIEDELPA